MVDILWKFVTISHQIAHFHRIVAQHIISLEIDVSNLKSIGLPSLEKYMLLVLNKELAYLRFGKIS